MATTLDDVTVTDVNSKSQNPEKENGLKSKEAKEEAAKDSGKGAEEQKDEKAEEGKVEAGPQEDEEVAAVEVEAKTGVAFPVKLDDGKRLNCVGLRKKSMLGLGIKIYGFGVYADNEKLKDLVKSKIGKSPAKPTKEMYQLVIDGDFGMTVRMVLVYSGVTMSMIKKNFDEVMGASIKKLTGGKKNDELSNKVMGHASDKTKLTSGSIIEVSRLPGYVLQTKVMGDVVSKVESELLCRAYFQLYLGDDAFDTDAKEKFGKSLLLLF